MIKKCCIANCRSYYADKETLPNLSSDEDSKKEWFVSLTEKIGSQNRLSVVCIKHFEQEY